VLKILTNRRRIVIAAAATALVLAGGSAAYAYFTSTGSGTGSGTVGSATNFTVTAGTPTGTMYPGSGSTVIVFTVTNEGTGDQEFTSADATIPAESDGDAESGPISDPSDITGCTADWFSASVTSDPDIGTEIAPGDSVNVTVTVTMPADSTDNQDACEGVTPDVTLTVDS
jgi:hypothetical protein